MTTNNPAGLIGWAGGTIDYLLTPSTLTDFSSKTFREQEATATATSSAQRSAKYRDFFKAVAGFQETIDINKGFVEVPLKLTNSGSVAVQVSSFNVTFAFSDCGAESGSELPLHKTIEQSAFLPPGETTMLRFRVENESIIQLSERLARCSSFSVRLNSVGGEVSGLATSGKNLLFAIDELRTKRAVLRIRHPGSALDVAVDVSQPVTLSAALTSLGHEPVFQAGKLTKLAGITPGTRSIAGSREETRWIVLLRTPGGEVVLPTDDRPLRAGDLATIVLVRSLTTIATDMPSSSLMALPTSLLADDDVTISSLSAKSFVSSVVEVEVKDAATPPTSVPGGLVFYQQPTLFPDQLLDLRTFEVRAAVAGERFKRVVPRREIRRLKSTEPVLFLDFPSNFDAMLRTFLTNRLLFLQFSCDVAEAAVAPGGGNPYAAGAASASPAGFGFVAVPEGTLDQLAALVREVGDRPIPVEFGGPGTAGLCGFRIPKKVFLAASDWLPGAGDPAAAAGLHEVTFHALHGARFVVKHGGEDVPVPACLTTSLCVAQLGGAAKLTPLGPFAMTPPPPVASEGAVLSTKDAFRYSVTVTVTRVGREAVPFALP